MADTDKISNFIRHIIEADLKAGKYAARHWSGQPGPAAQQKVGAGDTAKIRTRFPPEPNGYLHFGHAKSICLNFGLARITAAPATCASTTPIRKRKSRNTSIRSSTPCAGSALTGILGRKQYSTRPRLFPVDVRLRRKADRGRPCLCRFADRRKTCAPAVARSPKPERTRPTADRTPAENLALFRAMRAGEFADGAHILRARIDMASPNINLRDPAIYRIRHATHHNTGDAWCIYPMYTYAHPIEDALENITHSICTLEFEDQRPFYDWLLARLAELGCVNTPLPQQIEFSRLNLSYVVLSKRKLIQLVAEKHVAAGTIRACRRWSARAAAATRRKPFATSTR
jgi:glutaminyl-tRNA synthetase